MQGPYCSSCPSPVRCGLGDGCFKALGLRHLGDDDSGRCFSRAAGNCGGDRDGAPAPAASFGEAAQE